MDRVDQPCAESDPGGVDRVTVAGTEPVVKCIEIIIKRICISEDAVVNTLSQHIQDLFGKAEIHIRDPHGEQVGAAFALHTEVVF